MPNIQKTGNQSNARAKQHIHGKIKHLVDETIKTTMVEARLQARKIRSSFGKKMFSDSVDIFREHCKR